ncbi:MAG: ORF6N domain-containing protein [Rhodoferax sp.]|nr:ORF6N domain-containing protein [Rhodoferax sp.]
MLDADLATLYGVPTKRVNEQVKRNRNRFPPDFMFQLTATEKAEVVANCDHLGTLKFAKSLPYAFTEHGAIQAANVLASSQAVEMGIYVVRPLTMPPDPPKRPIGYTPLEDKSKSGKAPRTAKRG